MTADTHLCCLSAGQKPGRRGAKTTAILKMIRTAIGAACDFVTGRMRSFLLSS